MSEQSHDILNDREYRQTMIKPYLDQGLWVITCKANIPGIHKNLFYTHLILSYYQPLLDALKPIDKWRHEGSDGETLVYVFKDGNPQQMKNQMVSWEETKPYGRLVDIDVYSGLSGSIRRKSLRRCLLCDNDAFSCGRNQTHPLKELLAKIDQIALEDTQKLLLACLDAAIMDELNLDPKFGLVTPISNGSHFDMNYHTMLSAKDAILPYFGQMFAHGWQAHHEEQLFQKARSIGLEAETAMFQATKGINAYKGLIFNLGLMSSAFAYVITHQAPLKTMFPTIATMTKNLIKDFEEPKTTAGYEAYLKYRTMGARGEAMNGFPTVQQLIPMLNDFNDLTLLKVLIEAIKMTEDTVLIRRAGSYDMAKKIQSWFFNIDVSDSEALMQLTKRCIEANISFGGAADLLVCAILYCRLAKTFAF